jgi:hypothetical protein
MALTKMAPTDDEAAALTPLRAEIAADGAVEAGLSEAERVLLRLSEVDGLQRKLQVELQRGLGEGKGKGCTGGEARGRVWTGDIGLCGGRGHRE